MPFLVRKKVLQSIKWIDEVWDFDDEDGSAISLLNQAALQFANVTFGNGGDRKYGNFPEFDFCQYALIDIDDTLGGTAKLNSSSDFLSNWRIESCQRDWGEWKVLNNYSGTTKVKELVVLPGEELSWQSHEHRSELWFVREGEATVYYSEDGKNVQKTILKQHKSFTIPVNHWHQLRNDTEWVLSIIEIQYGSDCIESDIMRDTRPSSRI